MRSLISFFAREHLFGNLLTILLIFFGIASLFSIRRDLFPNVDFNTTVVSTTIAGASPQQVEKLLINAVEESVREVDGIKKIYSTATESVGIVVLQLDPDARDAEKTNRDIRQAVDSIEDLPDDATDPVINEIDSSQTPVVTVTVGGNGNFENTRQVAKFLYEEISNIKGVASVQKLGLLDKEILIHTNPETLKNRQISLMQLIGALKAKNWSLPGGTIFNAAGEEVLIRTESQYTEPSVSESLPTNQTVEEIKNTVITANDGGYATYVKDVAEVEETVEEPERLYKANGLNAIHLIVKKKVNADVLNLVSDLKQVLKKWEPTFPKKVEIGLTSDFSVYLKNRIKSLSSNLIIGLVLVIIVLSLFLPWQVTLVVAMGIPLALFSTLTVIYLTGGSINLISLIGLIIVLGMLVDDAIVVSENVWRHVEDGDDITESVVRGAQEVFWPVLASVLTTISAFAPMLFMTGIFGKFIFQIPYAVILALTFSLLEAFIIMPSHFISWVGPFVKSHLEKMKAQKQSHGIFDRISFGYMKYVKWSIQRRYIMAIVAVTMLLATGAFFAKFGRFVLFPGEGTQYIFVQAEAEKSTSLEQMSDLIRPIEDSLSGISSKYIVDHTATIGIIQQNPNDPLTRRGSNFANIKVALTPYIERDLNANQIVDLMKTSIGQPKGIKKLSFELQKDGPPQGRAVSINVGGRNFLELKNLAEKVKQKLATIEGVTDIRDSFVQGKDEWQVIPKEKAALELGLTSESIANSVRAAFAGVVATKIRDLDGEIDIRVKLDEQRGDVLKILESLKIGNKNGNLIPLPSVADFKQVSTIAAITHKDFKRVINVSADVDTNIITSNEVKLKVQPFVEDLVKEKVGYFSEFGGESEDTDESMQSLGRAFLFATLFILFLLIVTFRSVVQPILILGSIPMGFMGVIYAMAIHGRPLSFLSMLGVIALAGVIVNNAIVLIDFVNALRRDEVGLTESIIQASGVRLRPIVLTTTTTICGLLPTAYGEYIYKIFGVGGGDPFIVPIALALGWGLAFGSIMTGIFFPAFIRLSDDFRLFFRRAFGLSNKLVK